MPDFLRLDLVPGNVSLDPGATFFLCACRNAQPSASRDVALNGMRVDTPVWQQDVNLRSNLSWWSCQQPLRFFSSRFSFSIAVLAFNSNAHWHAPQQGANRGLRRSLLRCPVRDTIGLELCLYLSRKLHIGWLVGWDQEGSEGHWISTSGRPDQASTARSQKQVKS